MLIVADAAALAWPATLALCRRCARTGAALILVGDRGCAGAAEALEAGAADYLAKPYAVAELVARVHVQLRRWQPAPGEQRAGALVAVTDRWALDQDGQCLLGPDGAIPLPSRQYQLLRLFLRHEGQVLSRRWLIWQVWGPGFEGAEREVDRYVHALREKLERDTRHPRWLVTSNREGYAYRGPRRAGAPAGECAPETPG